MLYIYNINKHKKQTTMKATGSFTTTDGRQTTEMLIGELTSLQMVQESYNVFEEFLQIHELEETDRWFDIEEDEDGKKYATTGTVDLEYYVEVE